MTHTAAIREEAASRTRLRSFVHASSLGRWRLSVWQPDPRLAGLVTTMWFGEGRVAYQRDRILPSGQSQLLINLGPPQYRIDPGPPERRIPFVDTWYSGLHQGPIDTEAPHGNALLGVAFSARGSFPWLGQAMEPFADRIVGVTDMLGDGAESLRQRLLDTPAVTQRFLLVERWLLRRLQPTRLHPALGWAVDQIVATAGHVSIESLAAQTGFTRRHLSTLFRQQVGLSPKALARVHRFRAALDLLAGSTDAVPWTALAARCGFYDQAHLSNEIRRFSGFSPSELVLRDRPDSGSIVLR